MVHEHFHQSSIEKDKDIKSVKSANIYPVRRWLNHLKRYFPPTHKFL